MNNDLDPSKPRKPDALRSNFSLTAGSAAEKNEFLNSVGHELRNPLTNIIAQAETLGEGIYGPLEVAQKKALTAIQDSARQLLQLIADAMDLGRIEAGAAPLAPVACRVEDICAGSLALVAELARGRAVLIVGDIQPPNLRVLADARRLQQIITELLAAAVLSTPGGGQVRWRIAADAAAGGLHLQARGGTSHPVTGTPHSAAGVADTSPSLLSRLGKLKPIGLALLQQGVRQHGGSLTVRETADQEVSLSVHLPLAALPAAAPAAAAEPPAPETPVIVETSAPLSSDQPPTILIADDQPSLLSVTRNYLESIGFQVITARDGGEAVQQACTLQPDLILMDVRMPGVDGLSAIRQIRASSDPKTRGIAIVSLSGHTSASDKENCLAAGASAYLNKPFGVRELDHVIASLIRLPGSSSVPHH